MKRPSRGFTLLEVMVALAILAVSLVAILGINDGTVRSHAYAKRLTVATLLARSKMVDIETHFLHEGFTSEFDQTMEGDFSEEGWNDFRWRAEVVVPKLDAALATTIVRELVDKLLGDIEQQQTASDGGPTYDVRSMAAPFQGLLEGQMAQLVELLKRSVREVRLQVSWFEGGREETLDVVTHLVILPEDAQAASQMLPQLPQSPQTPLTPQAPQSPSGPGARQVTP